MGRSLAGISPGRSSTIHTQYDRIFSGVSFEFYSTWVSMILKQANPQASFQSWIIQLNTHGAKNVNATLRKHSAPMWHSREMYTLWWEAIKSPVLQLAAHQLAPSTTTFMRYQSSSLHSVHGCWALEARPGHARHLGFMGCWSTTK